jgi:AcrR family transcriptional regulator
VAGGTIYNSFASKADLLLSLLDPLSRQLPAALVQTGAASTVQPDKMADLLRNRWSDLTPETLDLLKTVLSEALVDRTVGDAFRARVLEPALSLLEKTLENAGLHDPALAARAAVGAFIGVAILRMLGDPVAQLEGDAVPDRITAILTSIIGEPDDV